MSNGLAQSIVGFGHGGAQASKTLKIFSLVRIPCVLKWARVIPLNS